MAAGDFVYNRLFAWKGSVAVASAEHEGWFVSSEFPCFKVNHGRLDPRFLWLYFSRQKAWSEALGLSSGSTPTSRNRLKEQELLTMKISLLPMEEQRRIVARIEELVAKMTEAFALRQQAIAEVESLVSRAASAALDDDRWETGRLGEILAESPRNGLSPKPQVETAGRPMLRINAVSSSPDCFVDLTAYKKVEVSDDEARPYVLQHEDVFIVRYNGDLNRVAKAAIFKGETNAAFPDKLMRLRPDREKMTPDFLVYALGCRRVRQQIEELGKTTAGQIGVSGTDAKSFIVPVPPLPEQYRIMSYLDSFQAKVDALRRLQGETAAELDALLPSILDKAFKGDL